MSNATLHELAGQLRSRRIDRRRFMQGATALGVSGTAISSALRARGAIAQDATTVSFWTTFVDPDLTAIKGFGIGTLPAIVHVGMELNIVSAVEGWDPPAWRALTMELSRRMSWSRPHIPAPGDPGPFEGAPLPRL